MQMPVSTASSISSQLSAGAVQNVPVQKSERHKAQQPIERADAHATPFAEPLKVGRRLTDIGCALSRH